MPVRRTLALFVLCALAVLQAGAALASHLEPTLTVGRVDGTTWDMLDPGTNAQYTLTEQGAVETWALTQAFVPGSGTAYSVGTWQVQMKADPFVTNNITLTNFMSSAQTFIVNVSLPIPGFNYNATIASSIGLTVTDSNGNGTASATSVSPDGIYSGSVNGSTILTLMPHLTTVSCATSGCSTTLDDNSAVPQLAAGPGLANTIGITLKFTLSAFDSIGITSRFEIINVPEPATVMLLGAGLAAFGLARRRAS